jgi:hypothetical protein
MAERFDLDTIMKDGLRPPSPDRVPRTEQKLHVSKPSDPLPQWQLIRGDGSVSMSPFVTSLPIEDMSTAETGGISQSRSDHIHGFHPGSHPFADSSAQDTEGTSMIKPLSDAKMRHEDQQRNFCNVWRTGVVARFPFRGFSCLLACLGCLAASVFVLVKSNDQPQSDWSVTPTVWVSVFTTALNILARQIFHDGNRIAWWYQVRRGTSIRDLDACWTHGDGFWSAILSAPKQMSFVTFASIAVTILVIDQPLMQRASTVVTSNRVTDVPVSFAIAREFAWGFTAYQYGRVPAEQVMTQPMLEAFNAYNSRSLITTGWDGCDGSCTGFVEGAGLAAMCTATSGPFSYPLDIPGKPITTFSAIWGFGRDSLWPTQILMNISFATGDGKVRTDRACHLAPATLRYPITITANKTLEVGDVMSQGAVIAFSSSAFTNDSTIDGGDPWDFWTSTGIFLAARNLFSSNATVTNAGGIGTIMSLPDTLSNQFLNLPAPARLEGVPDHWNETVPDAINASWSDPTEYILSSLNKICFLLALSGASYEYRNTSQLPPLQNITMQQTVQVNIFQSDQRWFVSSAVLSLVLLALLLPVFNGFWKIGRDVSLNPIETATAFDAPIFRNLGSNTVVKQLVHDAGAMEAKYGEVLGPAILRAENIAASCESHDSFSEDAMTRLRIADPLDVVAPRAGAAYR